METIKNTEAAVEEEAAAPDETGAESTGTPVLPAQREAAEDTGLNEDDLDAEDTDEDDEEIEDDDDLTVDGDIAPGMPSVLAGATAVVAAGLGLSSLTGTWLGTLVSNREQLIGQINASSSSTADQISKIYGTPWHTTALFNGFFAIVAILAAAAALVIPVLRSGDRPAPWIRAVAWGALALGVLGLFISGVMYFDVFAGLPKVAATATSSTTG